MSCWSYITGWVQVQPMGRTQEEKDYILKTVLNHLPVVQGSEEDMYVHIIKAGGYDMSCSLRHIRIMIGIGVNILCGQTNKLKSCFYCGMMICCI